MCRIAGTILALLLCPAFGLAVPPGGGLSALAVSADGKTIAVGGESRVVFLLSGPDLTVQRRIWLGSRVRGLAFSRDGSRLTVTDDGDTIRLLDVVSAKELLRADESRDLAVAAEADVGVARVRSGVRGGVLRLFSLADGRTLGEIETKENISSFGLDPRGKQLAVLTLSQESDERKVPITEVPRDFKGLARREFQLRNDGRVAILRIFSVPDGRLLREQTLWYTSDSSSTRLILSGDLCWVVNFDNSCARITAKGDVTLFETGILFNYALAASPDGKVLLAGGLREATFGPIDASVDGPPENRRRRFRLEPLPGADEFLSAGFVRPDGTYFAATTAYRLLRVAADGKVEKVVPVY
jgi:WD40 repeat protein